MNLSTSQSASIHPTDGRVVSFTELLSSLRDAMVFGLVPSQVRGLAYDSRQVAEGDLFFAIRGEVTDGHRYVEEALKRGAAGVISEQLPPTGFSRSWIQVQDARMAMSDLARVFFGDPSRELQLIGITGTKGKTTCTFLVDSVFAAAGLVSCRLGTIEYRIHQKTWSAERTTPEAVDLQRLLRESVTVGCTHGVMEVSSHSLVLHRVKGCSFAVACFTNLSRDHLDYHTDFENYFRAKRLLFEGGEVQGPTRAVVNISDSWGKRLRQHLNCPVTTCGVSALADVRPEPMPDSLNPLRFTLRTARGLLPIESRLVGLGNLFNILTTVAICQSLDLDDEVIARGIARLEGVPGRLELIDCGQPFTVIVDYAHTDVALENLLHIARGLRPARILTVFGCGGNRDRSKRPLMGETAARLSDIVILTNDNPRREDPDTILAEIEVGVRRVTSRYIKQADRAAAIAEALRMAQPGDIVLVAGKGHETYQEFADRKVAFDDRVVVRQSLLKKQEGSL